MAKFLFVFLSTSLLLCAADVSGAWSGQWEVSPDGGPGPHYMILKQDGSSVKGTAGPQADQQMAFQNGRLENDKLTFEISVPGGPSLKFEFTVAGDNMRGRDRKSVV